MRNGSMSRMNGRPSAEVESNQSRAARFEDEKRRIVESCFAKRDPDGTQLESYITHVRVNEDAAYPSSPPPPDSVPNNKKSRVILVAVRRSGKVRVHKARENPTGSFSIGKTWNLDELIAIQSYAAFVPSSQQENLEKQWAGNTGFLVSLGKPYYWQAATSKEKDFFIASLIKIFRKYTGGRSPQLIGFAPNDLELLTGGTPSGQPTPNLGGQTPPQPPPGMASPRMPAARPPAPASPPQQYGTRAPSRGGTRPEPSERNRSNSRLDGRPTAHEEPRMPSEDSTRSPARSGLPQTPRNVPRNRSYGDRRPSQDIYAARSPARPELTQPQAPGPSLSPKSSQTSLPTSEQRMETPRPNGTAGGGLLSAATTKRSLASAKSEESVGNGVDSGSSATSRPTTASSERKTPEPPPPVPRPATASSVRKTAEPPPFAPRIDFKPRPDRDNAPISSRDSYHSQTTADFVTPLQTPAPSIVGRPSAEIDETSTPTQPPPPQQSTQYFDKSLSQEPASSDLTPTAMVPTPAIPGAFESPQKASTSAPEPVKEIAKEDQEPTKQDEEAYRPGLGPMMKKKSAKDVANQFRKAAMAVNAFKPREGGAGARLKAMQDKTSNEPDGITGVVPAPLFRGMSSDSVASSQLSIASPGLEKDRPLTPLANSVFPKVHLQRTATEDSVTTSVKSNEAPSAGVTFNEPPENPAEITRADVPAPTAPPVPVAETTRSSSPQRKKRQRQEADIERFCSVLGLDARVMEGRGADFNEILTEFGWEGRLPDKQKVEDFETGVRREIGRAQAAGWLGHIEQQENRVLDLSRAFDKAILECEEMDGLLTLYTHELDTLHEDIEYIEAQSQGLQVQTANQKLLQGELQGLLKTLTISSSDLRALQDSPLDSNAGISAVERALVQLYRAMLTIDPEIRPNRLRHAAATSNDRTGVGVYADTEIGQMRAVRQKKEDYKDQTLLFVRRFNQHMTSMFKMAEQRSSEDNSRSMNSGSSSSLKLPMLQTSRLEMWTYNPMMLFVREVNSYEWQTLVSSYEINIKSTYQDQFRENVMAQRRTARKPTGEEQEILFTHHERDKPEESMTTTAARKLTVKRGKTVKTSALRSTFGERRDGKPDAWEVFDVVLREHTKVIAEEQNFIVHLFHLNSQSTVDFADNVASRTPEQRALPNLNTQLAYEPDRDMAKIVQQAVDGIYSFWATDMQALVEWVLKQDQLQGVGVLCALERSLSTYEETNQEFITRTLRSIHDRISGLFHKFVEEQVKAIEETKVKISKRKGIISFMRIFPMFSVAVEAMIPREMAQKDSLELRFVINDAYSKILKAMWESLNFIAKDNPASGSTGAQTHAPAGGDPEDKEALNYHILLIENMNHYLEEVQTHHNVVLGEWGERASQDLYKHLTQYTDAVIRRPLGKWLDFLESTEALLKTNDSYASIASKPSHSRSAAKKVLASYDAKEVRKGIDTLRKRIEKHFGDVDDPSNTSKSLITRVFEECGTRYAHAHDRMKAIIDSVYDGNLEIDWSKQEVASMFRR